MLHGDTLTLLILIEKPLKLANIEFEMEGKLFGPLPMLVEVTERFQVHTSPKPVAVLAALCLTQKMRSNHCS